MERYQCQHVASLLSRKSVTTTLRKVNRMKFTPFIVATLGYVAFTGLAVAQTPDDPTVAACKATGLLALQAQAGEISDLVFDIETLAISSANTKIEDIPVTAVVMGDAYIVRKERSEKPDRFVCLLGEKGKVLLTFFTSH